MVNCEQCGWNNPEYAAFCTNCGTGISKSQDSGSDSEKWRFRETVPQTDAVVKSLSGEAESEGSELPDDNHEQPTTQGQDEIDRTELPESLLQCEEESTTATVNSGHQNAVAAPGARLNTESDAGSRGPPTGDNRRVGIRPAATLVDLTVPDFRAMVGRDGDEKLDVETPQSQVSPGKVTIGLADTATSFEAVQPDDSGLMESDMSTDSANLADANQAEADTITPTDRVTTPAQSPIKDLGSLDVTIESVDGHLNVVDVYHNLQSMDESADALLSSIDITPVLEDEHESPSNGQGQKAVAAPPPPMPQSASLTLERISAAEAQAFVIGVEPQIIGRDGDICIANDDFMSPQHAMVAQDDDGLWVEDASSLNGVWLRARSGLVLTDGIKLMMGQQIFRFEQSERTGREPCVDKQGTRRAGSPRSLSGYRLVQLGIDGVPIAQFEIPRDGCKIGRSLADFVVCDDDHLSMTHAVILPVGDSNFEVRDLSTGNGCWLKLDTRRLLTKGDVFLTGRSVWHVC